MALDNRELAAGTVLVATYKKASHRCEVVATGEGLRFKLEDGKLFKSPSSAGRGITGRVSCDGWKFWSLDGEAPEKPATEPTTVTATAQPAKPKPANGAAKMVRQIKKLPNQKGVAEGSTKWFCSGCMKSFLSEGQNAPQTCPEGHAREAADEFAAVPQEAAETE
jgi:hypothetical protein